MVDEWDPDYTDISLSLSYTVNTEDVCNCNDEYHGWYYECDCPSDPRVTWIGYRVRIPQKPIKTAPVDTMYTIQVFDMDINKSEVHDRDLFCTENMTAEFSVINSISYENNKTYVGYLKKYVQGTDTSVPLR